MHQCRGGGRPDGFPRQSYSSAGEAYRLGGVAVALAPLVRSVSYGRPISIGGRFRYTPSLLEQVDAFGSGNWRRSVK